MLLKNKYNLGREINKTVQILRAIAVLAVIANHFAQSIFPLGYLGVDVFFVISGFVLAPSLRHIYLQIPIDGFKSIGTFTARRILRLVPAQVAVFFATIPLVICLEIPNDHQNFLIQYLASFFYVGNLGAMVVSGNYFHPNPNPALHLWSLSVEEQFYIGFPLIMILTAKGLKAWNIKFRTIIWSLFIASVLLFFITQHFTQNQNAAALAERFFTDHYFAAAPRIWEFLLGVGIYQYLQSSTFHIRRISRLVIGSVSIMTLSCLLLIVPKLGDEFFSSLIITSITAVALFNSLDIEFSNWIFSPLLKIGSISYSLYLVHYPLLYLGRYSPISSLNHHRNLVRIISLMIAFPAAYLLNITFENRYRKEQIGGAIRPNLSRVTRKLLIPAIALDIALLGIVQMNYFGINPNPHRLAGVTNLKWPCQIEDQESPCRLTSGEKSYLLIGDSHARMLISALNSIAKKHRIELNVWVKSGCQFTDPALDNVALGAKFVAADSNESSSGISCQKHNKLITDWLKHHPQASLIISQRSSSMAAGNFGFSPKKYDEVIAASIKKLSQLTYQSYVILPTPEFPDSALFFSGNLMLWQKPYLPPKFFKLNEMSSNPKFDAQYLTDSFKNSKVRVIETLDIFCEQEFCNRWKNGWLYEDGDHLSLLGADKFIPRLIASLKL